MPLESSGQRLRSAKRKKLAKPAERAQKAQQVPLARRLALVPLALFACLAAASIPEVSSSPSQLARVQREADLTKLDELGLGRNGSAVNRHPRFYRIRAAGANGLFASSSLRVNQPTSTPSAAPFGARNQQQQRERLQLAPEVGFESSAEPRPASSQRPCAAEVDEAALAGDASSISASSPTLRLTQKAHRPPGGHRQAAASAAKGGELDESPSLGARDHIAPAASTGAQHQLEAGVGGTDLLLVEHGGKPPGEQLAGAPEPILSLVDEFDSQITTNKTQAELSCDSGEMVVRLNFSEPFRGVVYPDHNRLSPCRFFGDGHLNYELRLPLRGCGTRQVAARVFVNDVIVRFHKTLELEEDEVKTLICRYPPPLDANGGLQAAAGYGAADQANRTLPTSANDDSFQQSPNQFELVDLVGSGGRPATGRFGTKQPLSPDAFGELLAAPPSGRQRQHAAHLLDPDQNQSPAERILLLKQQPNKLIHPAAGDQQTTNSRLFSLEAGLAPGDSALKPRGGYLDRLTSVELLFLISSLTFLVLLGLGLAGSYYYCAGKRGRRREVAGRSGNGGSSGGGGAARLLRRHRKGRAHFVPTPASLFAAPSTIAVAGRPRWATGTLPNGGQLVASAYKPAAPLYYQQYLQQQSQYQPQMQAQYTAPSSLDESDLSGRNLLANGNSGSESGDKTGPSASATALDPLSYLTDQSARAAQHYQSSSNIAKLANGRHKPLASVPGRRQMPDLAAKQTYASSGGRRAGLQHQAALERRTSANLVPRQQQNRWLALSSVRSAAPGGRSNTLGRRANRLASPTGQGDPLLRPAASGTVGPANGDIGGQQLLAQMRHARSLQQLEHRNQQQHPPELGELESTWDLQARKLDDRRDEPLGGRRFGDYLNDNKIKLKQRRHFFDTTTLARGETGREFRVIDLSSASDESELEQANKATALEGQQGPEPKLILKSIEDSFVTNFTEIYEQEYKKFNSMRPLSLAEWHARQPQKSSNSMDGDQEHSAASGRNPLDGGAGAKAEDQHRTSQTNLRSLTELDVNFARSLLRPTSSDQRTAEMQKQAEVGQQIGEIAEKVARQESASDAPAQPPPLSAVDHDADLVISPEYDCAGLQLRPDARQRRAPAPGGSRSPAGSDESISYV